LSEPADTKPFSIFDDSKSKKLILKVILIFIAAIAVVWGVFIIIIWSLSAGAQTASDKFVSLAAKGDAAAAYQLTGAALRANTSAADFKAYDKGLARRLDGSPKSYSAGYQLAHYNSGYQAGKHINYVVINYSVPKNGKAGQLYITTKMRKYNGQWAVDDISDSDTPPANNLRF